MTQTNERRQRRAQAARRPPEAPLVPRGVVNGLTAASVTTSVFAAGADGNGASIRNSKSAASPATSKSMSGHASGGTRANPRLVADGEPAPNLNNGRRGPAAGSIPRMPPKRVIYRSTNLTRTAPSLGAGARDSERIREAHRIAEEVREQFRMEKASETDFPTVTGIGETADAQRHKRRVKMNRDSAAISRVRREAYVSALELQLITLEKDFERAQTELGMFQGSYSSSAWQRPALPPPRRLRVADVAQHVSVDLPNQSADQPLPQESLLNPAGFQADIPTSSASGAPGPSVALTTAAIRAHGQVPVPPQLLPLAFSSSLPASSTDATPASPAFDPKAMENTYGTGGPTDITANSLPGGSLPPVFSTSHPDVRIHMIDGGSAFYPQSNLQDSVLSFPVDRDHLSKQVVQQNEIHSGGRGMQTADFLFPELVPQLAEIEPDFFSNLMTDYSLQGASNHTEMVLDDPLLICNSLVE